MKITRYILALALALCATGAQAQAISALPAASTLGGTEVTAVVQSATTKKATIDQIKTWTSNAPTLVTPALGTPASGNFSTGTFTWPTFNQSTTGSAATLTTTRAIYGNNFDGTASLTQVIASTFGGTGNGFTKFTGPTTTERTFTLPDADATILYSGGAGGTPSSITLTNASGTAASLTAGTVTTNANLTGDVTSSGNATTLATVNSNVGSFTNSSITVNGKGLITAASSGAAGATLGANTFTALQTITQASTNAGILASTGYSLTGSNATSMIDLAGTWNTTGVPTALKLNITNTASGTGALLIDLQTGGTSRLKMNSKSGVLSLRDSQYGAVTGVLDGGSTALGFQQNGTDVAEFRSSNFKVTSAFGIGWTPSSTISAAPDLVLTRPAAATLQQGAANAASPVAQTLQAQGARSGTDTNVAGASYTFRPGAGTGTAIFASLILATYVPVASGTGAQTSTAALTLSNSLTLGSHIVTPASSGTRYLCIDTGGVVTSSASACSGT